MCAECKHSRDFDWYTSCMYNHAPDDYICPICLGAQGIENEKTLIRQSDIVYQDDQVMVFVASYFIGNNRGHLIVVPLQHVENIYDLPDDLGSRIYSIARKMAITMKKAYECEGIMTLQNNEPASGQHALHYHLHLFPRYPDDNIHSQMESKRETTVEERLSFAEKIRLVLEQK